MATAGFFFFLGGENIGSQGRKDIDSPERIVSNTRRSECYDSGCGVFCSVGCVLDMYYSRKE